MKNKAQYREMLDDVCSEYCSSDKYCLLKEVLVEAHMSERLIIQLKCIEKFKFEKSKECGNDVGWTKATEMWVDEGYAKKFAELYNESIKFIPLYREIMSRKKKVNEKATI